MAAAITLLAAASARSKIADYVAALVYVYTLLIFIYVLVSLVFSLGARLPYSRWTDAVLGFLRDVCEPYLRIFRRFIPLIGPLDISPIVAIVVLNIVGNAIVSLIRG
jgi:YggT family protein